MKAVAILALIALTLTSTAKAEFNPKAADVLEAAGVAAAAGCGLAVASSIAQRRAYGSEMVAGCVSFGAAAGAVTGALVSIGEASAAPAPSEAQLQYNDSEE